MQSIPMATLVALSAYEKTGDAEKAMALFREYGGMEE